MTRKDIIEKVQYILKNNSQIGKIFEPIIEEFLVRLVEQFNFNEKELDEIINKYKDLKSMEFYKGEETGRKQVCKDSGCFNFFCNYDDMIRRIKISDKRIYLDRDYLKYILLGKKDEIESFIETSFHEQGHFIKFISEGMCYNNGLNEVFFTKGFDYISWMSQGNIINEFAQIINAKRLSKGNLNEKNYNGYQDIQCIARTLFSSLGISDEKLGELQIKGIKRQDYEKYIEQKIGKDYKKYLIAMEDALDSIYSINIEMSNTNLFKSRELRRNLAMQIETINSLSNEMIKRRMEKLGENPNVTDLAKIIIDKRIRDENLSKALKQFKSQLPIGFKIKIQPNMIGQYKDNKQLQQEIDEIQEQDDAKKSLAIEYDNNILISEITQLAQSYDISKFTLKDRIYLTICKNIGNIRRIFNKTSTKLLSEKSFTNIQEQRKKFVSRISESYENKPNNINLYKPNSVEKRKGRNENIR